jgi:hypothetical protein
MHLDPAIGSEMLREHIKTREFDWKIEPDNR